MVYLIKIENGKIHHFKISIEGKGIRIIEGVFYNWIADYWRGCGNEFTAEERLIEKVNEKLNSGFHIADHKPIPENTVDVYDKAKWHFEGEFPEELDAFQGYVHTGIFLSWLIDNNLVSDEFQSDFEEEIKEFKNRKLTGPQIFERCDGVLMLDMINELGNRFALHYFDFEKGQYLSDYETTLATNLPSLYHVADTWENYEKIKQVLDRRFTDWKKQYN